MARNTQSTPPAAACRLCLVTPAEAGPDVAGQLELALGGGDVACLFVAAEGRAAEVLIKVAQRHGVAAIVTGDPPGAKRLGADGLLVEAGFPALKTAIGAGRPNLMVGAGNLTGRDNAMRAGELDPDFLFFGRLDGDTGADVFPKAFALAAWWSDLFEIPAVVMGGTALHSVAAAAEAGIEFVCLRQAVWTHPDGPAAAVRQANLLLAGDRAETAT